jgi:hypothetical protein
MKSKEDENFITFIKECSVSIEKVSFLYSGDLEILKKDIDILYEIDDSFIEKEVLLRLVDYSKFHNKETIDLHNYSRKTWHEAVELFDKKVKKPTYWLRSLTDFPEEVKDVVYTFPLFNLYSARRNFENKINKTLDAILYRGNSLDDTAFILPESVYYYFVKKYKDLNAILIKNNTFGGSYIVSGLLTKNDILHMIKGNFKNYIADKKIFGNLKRDIMGNTIKNDLFDFNLFLV